MLTGCLKGIYNIIRSRDRTLAVDFITCSENPIWFSKEKFSWKNIQESARERLLTSKSRFKVNVTTLMFVRRNRTVLLNRHREGSRFSGYWNGVGGHLETGEDIHQAACREVAEEAGIEVRNSRLRLVLHESDCHGEGNLVFWFVADWSSGTLHPEPGAELRWVPLEKVSELKLLPDVREVWSWLFKIGPTRYGCQIYNVDGTGELRIEHARTSRFGLVKEG